MVEQINISIPQTLYRRVRELVRVRNRPVDDVLEPAAPVAPIGLSPSGETTARRRVTALLDSRADATMIPVDELTAARARYVGQRQMRGVVGESVRVNTRQPSDDEDAAVEREMQAYMDFPRNK